jgi:hypothetical protein
MKKLLLCALLITSCQAGCSERPGNQASRQPAGAAGGSASPPARPAALPTAEEQKAWLARAHRHEKHGWIYLHIEGQPRERGFQHGCLLAAEIREALRVTKAEWEYESGMDWTWLVEKAKTVLAPKIDAENVAEIDGIVEGLSVAGVASSRQEIVALNGIMELDGYWWPQEKDKLLKDLPGPSREACSAFIATGSMTADRGVVLGHNTMSDYADVFCNVILDVQPAKGHRILMQTAPGWIHSGTDFFITDAGLVGAETTLGGFKGFDEKGIPEFARMRRAVQDAATIEGWRAIMEKDNNGAYANAWLVGNINTKEIARLELGLKYRHFEKKSDGYFCGSNIAEDIKILRLETSSEETDIRRSSVARRVRWKQLMKENSGTIDAQRAKALVADHYDSYLQKDLPGGRCLCAHSDLDSQMAGSGVPFSPKGTIDGKVVDTRMARRMSFAARWGAACGAPFDAGKFLAAHPQFDWMHDILKSRPAQPWTDFTAGERE